MALAPQPWPDWPEAALASFEPLDALVRAIDERRAAASSVNASKLQLLGSWEDLAPGAVPNRAALERIRDAICELAGVFVLPDLDVYDETGFTQFPGYSAFWTPRTRLPLIGDHPIGAIPDPGACESDPAALDAYRDWLANCAWWIERFRYLVATTLSRYTTRTTRYSGGVEEVDEPEGGYAFTAVTESRVTQSQDQYCNDSWVEGRTDQGYDAGSLVTTVERTGRIFSGLIVANPASIDAQLVLLPVRPASRTASEYRTVEERTMPRGPVFLADGETDWAGNPTGYWTLPKFETVKTSYEWIGDGFKEISRETNTSTAVDAGDDDSQYDVEHKSERTEWAPDGSGSWSPEPELSHGVSGFIWKYRGQVAGRDESVTVYDGLGLGMSPGILYADTVIRHHGEGMSTRLSRRASVPSLDVWNPINAGLSAPGPCNRRSLYSKTGVFSYLPLLDYGPYFSYGRTSQ